MKTKRLSGKILRFYARGRAKFSGGYEVDARAIVARDALAYRRALRKVRRYFEPRALEGSMSGSLALQQLNIIDRALGAKR